MSSPSFGYPPVGARNPNQGNNGNDTSMMFSAFGVPHFVQGGGGVGSAVPSSEDGRVQMTGAAPDFPGARMYISQAWANDPNYSLNPATTHGGTALSPGLCGYPIHGVNLGQWAEPNCIYGVPGLPTERDFGGFDP